MNSVHLPQQLVQHLAGLRLPLSQPQQRHLAELLANGHTLTVLAAILH